MKKPRPKDEAFSGGGEWIRTTEGGANRFTVCPLWPLGNSPIYPFLLFASGAGGRTRTPDLLITNRSQPVRSLISWPFWHFPLGISRSLAVLFPLCFSARFPVWVGLWVVGRKRRKGGSKIGMLKQRKRTSLCLRNAEVCNLRISFSIYRVISL